VLFLLQRFFITNSIDMELTIGAIFIMKVIQMKIGEVSKKYNISIETLRFYDKVGLLVPERINNIRYYSERHIKKLKEILKMKKLMFTLDEIKGILELDEIIDKGLEEDKLNKEAAKSILKEVKLKYEEISEFEKEIKILKLQLVSMISKIENAVKGGNLDG
jgi:DNA-binding transcriptional MerR regulator